jgi:alpha-L-fucosidase
MHLFQASNIRGNQLSRFGPGFLNDDDRYSYWATDDEVLTPSVEMDLKKVVSFNVIRLRENIKLGQRITSFALDVYSGNNWKEIAVGTSIGANRLIRLPQTLTASKLRLRITSAHASVALSDFALFREPPHLAALQITRKKDGMVMIAAPAPVASIHYTLDGSEPTLHSPVYTKAFSLNEGGLVKARSFETGNRSGPLSTGQFGYAKAGWKFTGDHPENAEVAIDENPESFLELKKEANDKNAMLTIDMGRLQSISALTYLPRQDQKKDGIADKYLFSVSTDGVHWTKVAEGEFANIAANPLQQTVSLPRPVTARYFRFEALHVLAGEQLTVAELGVMK